MVWTVLESFGVSGLSIVGLIVVARYISPDEMGVAAMAQGIVQILNVPVEFLFSDVLIRRKDDDQLYFDTAHTVSIVLGITFSLLCWLFNKDIAALLGVPAVGPVLAWMSLSMVAMGLGTTIAIQQRKRMEFKTLALRSFVGRLAGVTIGILIAVLGGGVWSLVAQQVLMVGFSTLVLWVKCTPRPSLRFSWSHFHTIFGFGLKTITSGILSFSVQRVFMLMVGSSLGTAAAGYFNLAFRAVDILRDIVANAAMQLSLPLFSRHSDSPADIKKIYNTALRLTCMVTFPIFAGLAICSEDMVRVVFGPQWANASMYVTFLSALTLIHFSRLYSYSIIVARGFPHFPLISNLASLIAVVAGMLFFGQASLEMAAVVWALRLLVSVPIDMWSLKRVGHIGYVDQFRGALIPLISCAVMAGVLYYEGTILFAHNLPIARLTGMVCSGGIIFLTVMWFLDRKRLMELWQFVHAGLRQKLQPVS
jgi:PST family polysaccharide transporter